MRCDVFSALVMFYLRRNIPREVSLQASSLHSGSSSQLGSKLETGNSVILRLYWASGLNWAGNSYHVALRQLVGPEGGGGQGRNCQYFTSPSLSCLCRNELLPWSGRLRCWYPCCVFVTLAKKALLLIVSHGAPCAQYS